MRPVRDRPIGEMMHEDAVTPQRVESADGTDIAYDTVGAGPLVIVIGGAFNTRLRKL